MGNEPDRNKFLDFISNPAIVTFFVVGILLAIVIKVLFNENFLNNLGKIEVARGLITSLISIGTIGIGIVIISANYISQGEDKQTAKEKFNQGKDILTLFVGILGTIIGYYFGSNNLTASTSTVPFISPSPSTSMAPLISPSPSTISPSPSTSTAPLLSPSPSPKKMQ